MRLVVRVRRERRYGEYKVFVWRMYLLSILSNLESGMRRTIEIVTTDSATGTQVTLQREADRENLIDETKK